MVSCKQCNTLNSIDSTFCKKCGTTLAQEDIAEATDKLTAMIADGNKLFADGRTDEAMMVAETAVANNPSSAAAISLKGMCHERKGQVAEALECFERVIQLNPDSMLDKIKVNDLRNMMVAQKLETPRADRRMPLVAAFAATILVIAGGALIAKAASKPGDTNTSNLVATNDTNPNNVMRFGDVMGNQANNNNNNTQTQQPQQPQNGGNGQTPDDGLGPQSPAYNNRSQMNLPSYGGRQLPRPDEGAGNTNVFGNTTVEPVHPGGIPTGGIGNGNQNNGSGNRLPGVNGGGDKGGVDPPPVDDNNNPGKGTTTEPPKEDNHGIVEITVVNPGKGNNGGVPRGNGGGGNSSAASPNGREALVQAARSQYLSGNFGGAANTYERALRAGADPASTNQRLGQCYERMGRNSDAIAAYQRAASAIEAAMGNGGSPGLQRALDSCRQAIKVLGG